MASARGERLGAMWGAGLMNQSREDQLADIEAGYNTARDLLSKAGDYYKPYADRYNVGAAMYSNALGLGGDAGKQAARDAFTAGPGYQFNMDQGLQALMRKRAASGMLGSGNADADTLKYSQGLAGQEWDKWLGHLGGMDRAGAGMASAQAGQQGALANLASDYYNRRAGIKADSYSNIAGLGLGAFKAGGAARAQNDQMRMAGVKLGADVLGAMFGMPGAGSALGGFTNLFGGGGASALSGATNTGLGIPTGKIY